MAFLCPVRIKKQKHKGVPPRSLNVDVPLPGRITGSDSIDTLVRVGIEKEHGPRARMVVVHDFLPCVDDELAVKRGQQVHVLYQENDWLYVITTEGKEGFIPYTYCLPVERSVDDFVLPKSKQEYLTQTGYKVTEGHVIQQQQTQSQRTQNNQQAQSKSPLKSVQQQRNASQRQQQNAQNQHQSQLQQQRLRQQQQYAQQHMNQNRQNQTHYPTSTSNQRPQSARQNQSTAAQTQSSNLERSSSKSLPDIAAVANNQQQPRREGQQHQQEQQRQRSKSQDRYQSHSREPSADRSRSRSNNKSFQYSTTRQSEYGDNQSYTSKSAPTTPDWRRKPDTQPDLIHDYYNIVPLLSKSSIQSQAKSEMDTYTDMDQMRSRRNYSSSSSYTQSHTNEARNDPWQRSNQYRASSKSQPDTSTMYSSNNHTDNRQRSASTSNSSTLPRNFSSQNAKNPKFQRAQSLHIPDSKSSEPQHQQQRISHQRQNSLPATYNHSNVQQYQQWNQQPDVVCQVFQKHSYGQYIVLYSYSPRQENDLSVERGEFVTVLNREDSEWFWVRNNRNQEGFVPRTFIIAAEGQEEKAVNNPNTITKSQQQPKSVPTTTKSQSQRNSTKPGPPRNFSLERATRLVCLYDYKAQAPDDLSVSRGQWLYADLEGQGDPEWLWVFSPLSKKAGYIPRTYAKPPNFGSISGNVKDPYMSP